MENIQNLLTKYELAVANRAIKQKERVELDKKIEEFDKEIQSIRELIESLVPNQEIAKNNTVAKEQNSLLFQYTPKDYDPKLSRFKKALYVLRKFGRPLTARQIVNSIKELEPNNEYSDRQLIASISSALIVDSKKEKNLIRKRNHESDEWRYYLKDWHTGVFITTGSNVPVP